jgi:hypothetical protein
MEGHRQIYIRYGGELVDGVCSLSFQRLQFQGNALKSKAQIIYQKTF